MGAAKGTASWNAGTGKGYVDRRGYRWIRVKGKNVREHRHVMETMLQRKLSPGEIVHHKNGDKLDNRISNLALAANGDHTRIHHKGETRPDMTKQRMATAARQRERIKRLEEQKAELLEALQNILPLAAQFNAATGAWNKKLDAARAAIAKVTGDA